MGKQYAFGSGVLYGTSSATGATPQQFGALQDVSIDISASSKELHGQYAFPLAVARGKIKVSGTAKFAQINGQLFNELFFNASSAIGNLAVVNNESGTPASSTVTVANSATFADDLGVIDAVSGLALLRTTSATPTAGQYKVASGVYTFSSGDTTGKYISYTYNAASTGKQITVVNPLMGVAPIFTAVLSGGYNGQSYTWKFPACTATKLSFATKLEDFVVPEFDFEAFADSGNNVMYASFAS